ncbi:hypothetical protein HPC49_03440 [Pyxidicoccus fallax]|uniref:SAF domain-containing protein n=1 Tax=Pyxidicoccus fallax TaxID=394095 RepID=A0A848LC08_9BACT|nr:SAF domain-containing protein [Pyxidicoccus fallax]NMO15772.1 hypothetical protein [Pyxidicoccus fallax]NPC77310.1 hypothetical protein [Pyxidicoccus fallax]
MRRHVLLMLALLLPTMPGAGAGEPARQAKVTVMVAVRDLAVGEMVTEADIAEVQVDREWVTTSVVGAEVRQYIVLQRVLHPVLKGDLFTWNLFETTWDSKLREGCTQAVGTSGTALEQVSRARQVVLQKQR